MKTCRRRGISHLLVLASVVGFVGCAALRPVTEGQNGPLKWWVTNTAADQPRVGFDRYQFVLNMKNVSSSVITIQTIEGIVSAPGEGMARATETVSWKLDPDREIRRRYDSTRSCHPSSCMGGGAAYAPIWQFTLKGVDESGRPITSSFEIRLPAEPKP
jgi:hypothetical protein